MVTLTPEIRDVCAHCNQPIFAENQRPVLTVGNLTLYPAFLSCTVDGIAVKLTNREFDVLYQLAKHGDGKIVTKDTIFACVWGFDSDVEIKIVDVIVCKVRKKLGGTVPLTTHWGRGYSFGVTSPAIAA